LPATPTPTRTMCSLSFCFVCDSSWPLATTFLLFFFFFN
jgi:hypothetical protein